METVPMEWLTGRLEIKENVEKESVQQRWERIQNPQPNDKRAVSLEFVKSMFGSTLEENDELWKFSSPPDSWQLLCGRSGYALVRNGVVIDTFITKIS